MKVKIKIHGIHYGKPASADIEIEGSAEEIVAAIKASKQQLKKGK